MDLPLDFKTNNYEVNHKDYNRENNCANNLEWCTHSDNVRYSAKSGRYNIRDFNGLNNPNYGNRILSVYYKNNPDIAKEKLSRPAQQNGRATKVALYDKDMNYINIFDWIGGCAIYLRENGFTSATINGIRTNIRKAINNNKKYINHYFKNVA